MPENPIVVEVLRGGRVESRHSGAGAVVDADGRLVFAFGDVDWAVYPRSAVKAVQALPLIESGAADRFGLTDDELALACASHSGELKHVAAATSMLRRAGLAPEYLACGAHWPADDEAARALARAGLRPSALHNNCSGKHAGFLCVACALGCPPAGYEMPDHDVQRIVKAALEDVTGVALGEAERGVDGCSIPTYAIPLRALAYGFAKYGTGVGLSPARAAAARRLRAAVAARPDMVGGTKRFDTQVMTRLGPAVFTKTGAEGVFCAALPDQGLGLAVKIDDGAKRASEVAIAAMLLRFAGLDEAKRAELEAFVEPALANWRAIVVGRLRPAGPLARRR